ncbi:MAG TPA: DUF3299 domain-containing protein [Armatimonadota bacterium]|jgi:hypothetical protein
MVTSYQQQRQRKKRLTLIFGLLFAVVVVGGALSQVLGAPPGYASKPPVGQFAPINWQAMMLGQWAYGKKPVVPAAVQTLNGQMVTARGYLLPLHSPGVASQFFIAPKPRGCYFCSPPAASEVVQVNIAGGKQLPPTMWMVNVYGKLRVATGAPSDQVLYVIDDATLLVKHI